MAEILNKDYDKVREYDFICPHCGAMTRFKKHELSLYEVDDTKFVEYQCPNCKEYIHFPQKDISTYDVYTVNEEYRKRLVNTINESMDNFHKMAGCIASILSLIFGGVILFIFWLIG